ncbi:MAG TPA: hypothetical protein VE964_10110, partial [Myxococcales bacterium]|nr:hypothetical protein [Myxococcales bacterium]
MAHCRGFLGAAAVVLLGAGQTFAQSAPPWHLKGSDTLFDIMTQSILNARAAAVPGANNLIYDGTGSGNGENQMRAGTCPAGVAPPCRGVQSIAPMSRNFRPASTDANPSWTPGVQNVIGLDAAVVISKGAGAGSGCKNLNLATFVDTVGGG